MKKEIKISVIVLILFLCFLWPAKPLREYLSVDLLDAFKAEQISSIVIRTTLILAVAILITKLNLKEFTGLNSWKNYKNIQAMFIPLTFITMGLIGNWDTYIL